MYSSTNEFYQTGLLIQIELLRSPELESSVRYIPIHRDGTVISKADGKAAGALETDLRYIKESVGRIEGQLNRDVQRLEGRIDEISNQLAGISNTAGRAHESAKSAHNRIDEHLEREHNIQTDRRRSNAET